MQKKKNTCIEIEHVRGIVNQERNLNRTSLAKGKKREKEKKKYKQTANSNSSSNNKQKQKEKNNTSLLATTIAPMKV